MSAANSDKLIKLSRRWVGQIGSGGVDDETVTTIPLSATTNLPTDTAVIAVIDRVDVNGVATPTLEETVIGVVSGTNLINCLRGQEGTAQAHAAGAVVEILFTAKGWNLLVDHLLVEHGQDGKHTKVNGNTVTAGTDTVALLTASQTLTNKTLTSPKINEDVALTATATQLNAQVLAGNDGWTSANETWTYASASTITVPSGAAAKYAKGDKLKLTQTASVKYFYVIGVADTVLTVTAGTSYTLTNDTITNNYYSHQENPLGFPTWFNYTPVITGSAGSAGTFAFTNTISIFRVRGASCQIGLTNTITNVGSWSGSLFISLPITPATAGTDCFLSGWFAANNTNPGTTSKGFPIISASKVAFLNAANQNTLAWSSVAVNDTNSVTGDYPF